MVTREQLYGAVDHLDDRYVELVYEIVRRFSRVSDAPSAKDIANGKAATRMLQEIAGDGGLGH